MTETTSLYFKVGSSDKEYHLRLEQVDATTDAFNVTAQYGRRGGTLATHCKTKAGALPYAQAKKLFDKIKRGQLSEGYVEAAKGAPATQVDAPSETTADIKPQELLTEITGAELQELLADPRYWMQDKSDGHSRGVVKQAGKIFGINKFGKPVPLPAEIHAELSEIELETFQIDAELVGSKLVCRDLLVADGDISAQPYESRFIRLVEILYSSHRGAPADLQFIAVVRTWCQKEKRAALERSKTERREGVVFKLASAPYSPGRSGQNKKFKFVKTLSGIAGKPRAKGKDSVEVFLIEKRVGVENRINVGTVSLIGKVDVKEGDVLEIAYLYAYPNGKMVQARLLDVRDDVTAEECTTAQLVFRREETE